MSHDFRTPEAAAAAKAADGILHDPATGQLKMRPGSNGELLNFVQLAGRLLQQSLLTNQAPTAEVCQLLVDRARVIGQNHDAMLMPMTDVIGSVFRPSPNPAETLYRAAVGATMNLHSIAGIAADVQENPGSSPDPDAVLGRLAEASVGIYQILNMFGWTQSDVEMRIRGIVTAAELKLQGTQPS